MMRRRWRWWRWWSAEVRRVVAHRASTTTTTVRTVSVVRPILLFGPCALLLCDDEISLHPSKAASVFPLDRPFVFSTRQQVTVFFFQDRPKNGKRRRSAFFFGKVPETHTQPRKVGCGSQAPSQTQCFNTFFVSAFFFGKVPETHTQPRKVGCGLQAPSQK